MIIHRPTGAVSFARNYDQSGISHCGSMEGVEIQDWPRFYVKSAWSALRNTVPN